MRQEFKDFSYYLAIEWGARQQGAKSLDFSSQSDSLRFVQRISKEPAGMVRLRRLWQDRPGGAGGEQPSGVTLQRLIAARLLSGDLQAFHIPPPPDRSRQGASTTTPSAPNPALLGGRVERPIRLAAPKLPVPELPKEIPLVPDIEQQISTLLDAAKDGVPFCEQCAKALP